MTVTLVRHGQTEWSRDHRHTGRTDVPLTAVGREQAIAVGGRLAGRSWDLVLTSPLQRARQTAELAGLPAEPIDDLVEWDYGEVEGRTTVAMREEWAGWEIWRDGPPGGESVQAVGRRADRVLDRILGVAGDVAIVSHGHLLRVLAARWIGLPPERGDALALDTATISELGFERERRVIRSWNA